jgi:hypothetical protein
MTMNSSHLFAGAIAGTTSALAFTILHGVMISGIWFMLIPMLVAGAICGAMISWSYALLVDRPSVVGWLGYNALYIVLLFLLGPISLLLFEPIMTIPELVSSPSGLPDELFKEVLPLAALYTPLMALMITRFHSRRWRGFGVVVITCGVLVFLLGLNIAPMGLVYLSSGWAITLLEVVGLVVALDVVYAAFYLLIAAAGKDAGASFWEAETAGEPGR